MIFHASGVQTGSEMPCSGKEKHTNGGKRKTLIFQIQGRTVECNRCTQIDHLKIT